MVKIRFTNKLLSMSINHKHRRTRYSRMTREIAAKVPNCSVEQALRYAKATLAIEGQFVSKDAEDIVRKRVEGKMTHEQFKKSALALALKR